jgi:rhodanese-related sulfurtransferase
VVIQAEMSPRKGVDELLADARADIERYTVAEAFEFHQQGALLIDIRPVAQRAEYGEVPQARCIERNVLEWRLDPQCEFRLPDIGSYERRIIILCQAGYASSFAAASVRLLGYAHVGDVVGGFEAWRSAGLPTQAGAASDHVL